MVSRTGSTWRVYARGSSLAFPCRCAAQAQTRGLTNIAFIKGDARDLSVYRDRAFDKVLSINTPVSFAGSEWKRALAEMCRVAGKAACFTVSNFISCFPVLLDVLVRLGAGWEPLASDMFADHVFNGEKAKPLGIDFPSYRAFAPGEIEAEVDRLGFD